MCHENKMGAAKEQHPYINQVDIVGGTGWNRGWNRVEQWNSSGTSGTVTRPLFTTYSKTERLAGYHPQFIMHVSESLLAFESSCVQSVPEPCVALGSITVP